MVAFGMRMFEVEILQGSLAIVNRTTNFVRASHKKDDPVVAHRRFHQKAIGIIFGKKEKARPST